MHLIFKLIGLILPRLLQIGVPLIFAGWLFSTAIHAAPDAQVQAAAMAAQAHSRH
jgi:hypothetical protein